MTPSPPDIRTLHRAAALGLVDLRDAERCQSNLAAVVAEARAGLLTERQFVERVHAAMEPMRPALCRALALLAAATKTIGDGGEG
jgi:hypothetical protein